MNTRPKNIILNKIDIYYKMFYNKYRKTYYQKRKERKNNVWEKMEIKKKHNKRKEKRK